MTGYRDIAGVETDQDSPVTQPLMDALADNPLAIAEGDATAPKLFNGWQHALDAPLWSFAVDGAVSEIETPVLEDGYEYKLLGTGINIVGIVEYVYLAVSGSVSGYDLEKGVMDFTESGTQRVEIRLRYPRFSNSHYSFDVTTIRTSAEFQAFGDVWGSDQKVDKCKLMVTSGTFTAGTIYWLKRGEYLTK